MVGVGPTPSRLMIIGESPGDDEDKQGKPFVGKAGSLLDSILFNRKIKREEVFITNVLKCHPLYNSKPSASQMDICSSTYLAKEIELVKPDLIVCLGSLSAKTLLGEREIVVGQYRNIIHKTQGPLPPDIPFIVTYHPAATFHKPEFLKDIVDDLDWAKSILAGNIPKPVTATYKRLKNIISMPEYEDLLHTRNHWLSLDLETDGLDAFVPDKDILSLQLSPREHIGYYFDWNEKIEWQLRGLFRANPTIRLNGHNLKHDLKWLRVKAGIRFNGRINDTIINIHMIDENFPNKGLDVVASTFTPVKHHKKKLVAMMDTYIKHVKGKDEPISEARERLMGKAFKSLPLDVRVDYGCGDSDSSLQLKNYFRPKLKEEKMIPLHNLMMEYEKMFVEVECNGMKIDNEAIDILDIKYENEVKRKLSKLDRLSPVNTNPRSYPDLKRLIYKIWQCESHEVKQGKKKVHYSTGADAVELILQDKIPDIVRDYLTTLVEYRKIAKLHGTYIQGLPKYIRSNDIIHPDWKLHGTVTGRLSCSLFQQIPRKGEINRVFISRYPKGIIGQIDVSQGELRIGAHVANITKMIEVFNDESLDIHTATAANLLHINYDSVDEEKRYSAKQANFSIFYQAGARTAAQQITGLSLSDAYAFIKQWHRTYPEWKEWCDWITEFVIENGYVEGLFGRRRHLLILDPDSEEGHRMIRQAINSPIQGGLSDYNKLCGVNLWKRLKREKLSKDVLIIGELHDAWKLDIREPKLLNDVHSIIKEEFENVNTEKFGFKFKVPMRIEFKIGPNGFEMEEYK